MSIQGTGIVLPQIIIKSLQITISQNKISQLITGAVSEKLGKIKDKQKKFKQSLLINHQYYKDNFSDWEEAPSIQCPK
jgi:hypothetical protein